MLVRLGGGRHPRQVLAQAVLVVGDGLELPLLLAQLPRLLRRRPPQLQRLLQAALQLRRRQGLVDEHPDLVVVGGRDLDVEVVLALLGDDHLPRLAGRHLGLEAVHVGCVAKHDGASIQKLHDSYLTVADRYYGVFRELSQLVYGRDVKYVLLMHVGAFDARMLPALLAMYRAKGVKFISLPDAMSDPAYQDDPDIGEPAGGAFLELMMQKKKLKFPPNTKPYKELEAMCR